MGYLPNRTIWRTAIVAATALAILTSCGAPAATSAPTVSQPTSAPSATPLALLKTEIPGLVKNAVTFANIEYTLSDAFVSNQDPSNYAAGGSPKPTETSYAYLALSGKNPTQSRPDLSVKLFNLVLADGKQIPAKDLFGTGDEFIAPPANAAADGFLAFEVDPGADLTGASLRIGQSPDRPASLLLTASQPPAGYPVVLATTGKAHGTGVTNGSKLLYTLLGGGLYIDNPLEDPNYDTGARANEDQLFLVLDIRILMESGSLEGTFADQFRLLVDGTPRAPWNSPKGNSIGPGAAVDTKVGWLIPASAKDVVLQVGDPAKKPGTIPITLPAAP